jgi:hypothetical protein
MEHAGILLAGWKGGDMHSSEVKIKSHLVLL